MDRFSLRLLSQPNISPSAPRGFTPVKFASPNRAIIAGRDILSFVGADYLQLGFNPLIRRAVAKGLEETAGISFGPRGQWGTSEMHVRAEARLAEFLGTESALLMSSRSQACYSLLAALLTESDRLVFSERSESPLRDICELLSCQHDNDEVENITHQSAKANGKSLSMFILDSTNCNVSAVQSLGLGAKLQQSFSMVVVDETYALGGAGLRGAGMHEAFGFFGEGFCLFGELSPVVPSSMGFIAGPKVIIEEVRSRSRVLLFERGLCAAFLPALMESLDYIELMSEARALALQRRDFVADEIRPLLARGIGLECPLFPMIQFSFGSFKELESFTAALLERGVLVEEVVYSGVAKRHYQARIFINSAHTEPDLARLTQSLVVILSR